MKRVIIAFAVFAFLPANAHAATISDYASQIVGKTTPVKCIAMKDNYGETFQNVSNGVSTFDSTIILDKPVCYALVELMHGKRTFKGANAVLTLQHEAEHIVLNSDNEGIVECNAMMHISGALQLFHSDTAKMHKFVVQSFLSDPPIYLTDHHCFHIGMTGIGPVARKKSNA